jgi:secreted trypsin-like serine protease
VISHGATSNQDTLPNSLMEVSESVVSHQDCNDRNSYYGSIVFSAMLCAGAPEGGKGDCYGDSAGPLLIRGNNPNEDIQVGIVSFGANSGCALPVSPHESPLMPNGFGIMFV